jgi:hypothetical protein
VLQAGPLTQNGTQPPLSQPLESPGGCGCHMNYTGANIEPYDTWAGSMMAQASRDPLFWAALDVANNDIADVGDFCLRCHVPQGWLMGRSEPDTDGCGFEGKMDETDKDLEGLTCHFCHRMMINDNPPGGQDSVYFENGQYWIDDGDCGGQGEPCRRGPYDYPADGTAAPHAWDFSQYHEDSDNCGNCHNVTHPVLTLIQNGVDTGIPMPIERTFSEWQQSDFAPGGATPATCQNCHMPDATENPAYACDDMTNNHTGDMPIHQFAGGNAWIPDVLRQEYPNLDRSANFIATRDWALDLLQNESATVEVTAPTTVGGGGTLPVDVKVTNLTGHKLPTGYPEGRRMWLHVEVRDGTSALVWESGAWNPSTGVLTHDAQVKVYHVEPGIWNHNSTSECDTVDGAGDPMFHFVLNNCIAVDNRIPPLGFTGMNDPETQPVAYTYPETSPGSGILVNYDVTSYAIPIPGGTPSPLSVTATLRYQTTSDDYAEFLLAQSTTHNFPNDCIERGSGFPNQSRGEIFYDMWTTYGRSAPVDMDSDSASVTVAQLTPGETTAMVVTGFDNGTEDVTVSYSLPCGTTDHAVYLGDLANVASMSFDSQVCSLGASGTATFPTGTGDRFWVLVANDGSFEGSYGTDSNDVERPEDTSLTTCSYPQDLPARCDP